MDTKTMKNIILTREACWKQRKKKTMNEFLTRKIIKSTCTLESKKVKELWNTSMITPIYM